MTDPPAPAPSPGIWRRFLRLPMWQALADRDFRLLWGGESISILGDQFYFVAMPWLTLQLTGSAVALGAVSTAVAVPRGILILFGGALSDRASPRLVMLRSNAARTVLTCLLAALVLLGAVQFWQLFIIAGCFGIVDALFYPAYDSIAPLILEEWQLGSGNALLQGSNQLSGLVGPALAGAVIAAVRGTSGLGIAFAADAGSFACATAALLLMRGGSRPVAAVTSPDPTDRVERVMGEIAAGLRYTWSDPILRILLGVMATASLTLGGPLIIGLATLAHTRFPAGAAAFGVMFSVFGVGALLGTLVAGMMPRPRYRGRVLIGLMVGFSGGMIVIALVPNLIVVCAILGILGVGNGLISVMLLTWLQVQTEGAMMGRVMSVLAFAQFGVQPVSLVAAGFLAQSSPTLLFMVAGLAIGGVGIAAAVSRPLRMFD